MKVKKQDKGLTDAQLIEKYERGKVNLKSFKRMLKTPSKSADEKRKRKD